jgi:phage repressor protein C with HTH and peptisase S24 domain
MDTRRRSKPGRGERRKADIERIAGSLKRRGSAAMVVQGTGMLPVIHPGDIALIRRERLENMRAGDVVLFQRGEQLLAKRIGEDDDTLGDSMHLKSAGGNTEPQEYLGKIVRVRRDHDDIELSAEDSTVKPQTKRRRGPIKVG